MNKQSLGYAPSYRCPGCHVDLPTGAAAVLEHMNRCTALRGMIASGGGCVIGSTATGKQKDALRGGDSKSIGEKAATRRNQWKIHGPILSVAVENGTTVEMNLPATIKEKTGRHHIRKRSVKPHRLLDVLIDKMSLASNAALARMLQVHPNVIYSYRNGIVPISLRMLRRMHEATAIPMQELHALMIEMNLTIPDGEKTDRPRIRKRQAKPHRLLDALTEKMSLPSDAALANMLQVDPKTISRHRNCIVQISPRMLRRMHETADIPIRELHALILEMNLSIPGAEKSDRAPIRKRSVQPHRLLDALIAEMSLKNDAALARMLEVAPPVVSKQRLGKLPIGPSMLIRMHETTDIPIWKLRALMPTDASSRDKSQVSGSANKPARSNSLAPIP